MQVIEMKGKLEEKIRALEKEKSMLMEEVKELKEVVELNEKAKVLESEVSKLKKEARALKDRLPQEFLREIGEFTSPLLKEDEEENLGEECSGCEEELL
jgi:archaellum component FlaC